MTNTLPVDSLALPRFCGVPTFMRLEQNASLDGIDAAILGIPSDSGAPYRTGARFGPNAIRAQSVMLRPINPYRGGLHVFQELRVRDVGDCGVVPGYLEETYRQIEEAVAAIVSAGVVPMSLGGDHSVTLPQLRAVAAKHGPVALVHFDSHSDTWDNYFAGKKYSAGTPFRRGVEEQIIDTAHSIQIGMRGSLFSPTDVSQSVELGYEVLTTDDVFALGPDKLAERIAERTAGRPVFLTFDIDFVDPSAAPAVQTPEAGGFSAHETLTILRKLRDINLVGCDVVEVNPLYDGPGQITSLLAATVMAELLALLADGRRAAR
ncbi:agmatinase [Mesorhizobium sp. YM1C-6-2]|uniref:agmatinase n=1 Tax=Mesorhizobium sp. YM1C-6-2 TaxID=1827501 RepID=UPI000EF23BD1|nr:agmatinase [Mesorhizobium sp. YM1C-6-2]RLP27005.1 agmatinase [Mesorhizobium sp. YM1C-6-2]